MDTLEKNARSELMGRVKSKGTSPELALRKAARELGLSPSRDAGGLPGTPDMAFRSAKVAVFVDGCFWHGCPLHARAPSGENAEYWRSKIASNRTRDAEVDERLRELGWLPLRLWEHELSTPGAASDAAARVAAAVEARAP